MARKSAAPRPNFFPPDLSATVMRVPLCLFVLAAVGATAQAQNTPPRSSERTQQALRERLPAYNPAASEAARKAAEERAQQRAAAAANTESRVETTPDGEEIVILPEVEVRERKLTQPHPDDWLTSGEVTQKAMRLHAAGMNSLELALNRWHIPLLTPSFASRARASYETEKFRAEVTRFHELARTLDRVDPKAAKKIRDSLDFRKLPKDDE